MPAADPLDLEAEIDGLYAGPLGDFVAARSALAARLRAGGDRDAGRRVSGLSRPSPTAWAVNQLHWKRRALLDSVRESGARVRAAHEGDLAAGPLADALAARRRALSEAVRAALEALGDAGRGAGLAVERRVRGSLEAVAAGADARSGRLGEDLEPPGFDAISGLSPALAPAAAEPAPGAGPPASPGRDAGTAARRLAEAERARLERRLQGALAAEKAAEVRAAAARSEIEEAQQRLERARRRSGETDADLDRCREQTRELRDALAQLRRELEAVAR